jgi:hypothetical protein
MKRVLSPLLRRLKREKGQVGGMTILIGTVSALFIIGFLVMIYALVGGALLESDSLYTESSGSVTNSQTNAIANSSAGLIYPSGLDPTLRSCALSLTNLTNSTNGAVVGSGNYSISGCYLNVSTASSGYDGYYWNATGTYNYLDENEATDVINSTVDALANVVTWFAIIIVITVMVVLILLTTLIIRAIRGTGFTEVSS